MKAQNKGKYDLLKKEENRCIHWAAWLTGSVIQELPGYVWHLQHRCQQKKGKMWLETSVTKVRYSIECREYQASLVAQMAKTLPAIQETQVQPLHQKDPLEKGMATRSSILAWESPWTEEPGGLQSVGLQRVGHHWATKHTHAGKDPVL